MTLLSESVTGLPADSPIPGESEEGRAALIVTAAYDLLEQEGLEGLTIRAVLKKTGLARRAFYECFAGKDDLVLAVFEDTIRNAVNLYGEMVRPFEDPLERVRLIVTSLALGRAILEGDGEEGVNRRGAALSREHLRLAESRPDDLQRSLRPLINLLAEQLEQGMEAGKVRPYAPLRLATLVYNLVSTSIVSELLAEEGQEPDWPRRVQLSEELWDFCRRAIQA